MGKAPAKPDTRLPSLGLATGIRAVNRLAHPTLSVAKASCLQPPSEVWVAQGMVCV